MRMLMCCGDDMDAAPQAFFFVSMKGVNSQDNEATKAEVYILSKRRFLF